MCIYTYSPASSSANVVHLKLLSRGKGDLATIIKLLDCDLEVRRAYFTLAIARSFVYGLRSHMI